MTYAVFIINLDRSKARMRMMANQLIQLNIEYERISAIDGSQLTACEIEKIAPQLTCQNHYFRRLSAGEIGVALSHKMCWEQIVRRKLDFAIILEDDIELHCELIDVIKHLNKLDAASWDYIKLYPLSRGSIKNHAEVVHFNKFTIVRYKKIPLGMMCQAVSGCGAEKLLANYTTINQPIDSQFKRWWELGIRQPMGMLPYPVSLKNGFSSDINAIDPVTKIRQSKLRKMYLKLKLALLRIRYSSMAKRQFSDFVLVNTPAGCEDSRVE